MPKRVGKGLLPAALELPPAVHQNTENVMDYRGSLKLHPTVSVVHNASVLGDVEMGEDSCVLFNAAVRGDCGGRVIMGARCNVQESASVHVGVGGCTRLGDGVTIGHGAIVHGCTVGDNCVIGMGSIVLDGAQVGENCMIGAGALVTGTARIEPGMLVLGAPAKAVRPLSEAEIEGLRANAEEYVVIGRELAEQGLATLGACAMLQ